MPILLSSLKEFLLTFIVVKQLVILNIVRFLNRGELLIRQYAIVHVLLWLALIEPSLPGFRLGWRQLFKLVDLRALVDLLYLGKPRLTQVPVIAKLSLDQLHSILSGDEFPVEGGLPQPGR